MSRPLSSVLGKTPSQGLCLPISLPLILTRILTVLYATDGKSIIAYICVQCYSLHRNFQTLHGYLDKILVIPSSIKTIALEDFILLLVHMYTCTQFKVQVQSGQELFSVFKQVLQQYVCCQWRWFGPACVQHRASI